jgi:hypothetical protein
LLLLLPLLLPLLLQVASEIALIRTLTPTYWQVIFDWYHLDAESRRGELNSELDSSLAIQNEDVWISERVQTGLMSSSYNVGRYAPAVEGAEYHFHNLLKRYLSEYLRVSHGSSGGS